MAQAVKRQAVSEETVQAWKHSGDMWRAVAADLIARISSGRLHRMADVPATTDLALEHDCSTSTALKAKLYLVEIGYLTADRHGFYINGGD